MTVDRKTKFLISSVGLGTVLTLFSIDKLQLTLLSSLILCLTILVVLFVTHYPNITIKNVIVSLVLPLNLVSGALLTLNYFPSLSVYFKLLMVLCFVALFYISLLADNIFLVVRERNEIIPLYRVAVTWSQILVVLIAIPEFAGVLKTPVSPFIQALILGVITWIMVLYLMYVSQLDTGVKIVKVGEGTLLGLFTGFVVFASALALGFKSGESFLKSLFLSSVLMFVMNYVLTGYLKNETDKKMVLNYFIIVFSFLVLVLIFD